MEKPPIFQETQYFRQLWIWAIVLIVNAVVFYAIFSQIIRKHPFGNNPASDFVLWAVLFFSLLMMTFLWVIRLDTSIREEGIYVRLFPLHQQFRFYPWEEIDKCYVRVYDPIGEYGGWGLRGFGRNRAFNVSGNNGIQLEFTNGKRLLIGTQMPDEVTVALRKLGRLHQ